MKLPQLENFDFKGKKVLVRCDLDVPVENGKVVDDTRLRECLPTINYLLEQGANLILMGHLGRPGGKVVEDLSLRPVAQKFEELLSSKFYLEEIPQRGQVQSSKLQFKNLASRNFCEIQSFEAYEISKNIVLLENLRFDKREEENDEKFAKELASLGDLYVNEAFAASHRAHTSIVGVPKFLPHSAGLHFASEVENLSKVLENPQRLVVFVIGGAKPETKLPLVADFARMADWVLVGGTLTQNSNLKNVLFACLTEGGFDINEESVKKFTEIIKSAGTVVWNGPMGKYEDDPPGGEAGKWEAGTRRVAEAIVDSKAFKVVGGGDTIAALTKFNLIDKMNYVSTGGGAMLEFLAKGILPGIEALGEALR